MYDPYHVTKILLFASVNMVAAAPSKTTTSRHHDKKLITGATADDSAFMHADEVEKPCPKAPSAPKVLPTEDMTAPLSKPTSRNHDKKLITSSESTEESFLNAKKVAKPPKKPLPLPKPVPTVTEKDEDDDMPPKVTTSRNHDKKLITGVKVDDAFMKSEVVKVEEDLMKDVVFIGSMKKVDVKSECVGMASYVKEGENLLGLVKCKTVEGTCPTKFDMNVCEIIPYDVKEMSALGLKDVESL